AGALPLPAAALGDLNALFDPPPQPIPTSRPGLRRQIGEDQPWILVARLPARQQGTVELAVTAFEGDTRALPGRARLGHQGLQRYPTHGAFGTKRPAGVDAQKGMPAQAGDAPKQPTGIQA